MLADADSKEMVTCPGLELESGRGSFGAAEEGQTQEGRTVQTLGRLLYCRVGEGEGGGGGGRRSGDGWTREEGAGDSHHHHHQQHYSFENVEVMSLLNGKGCGVGGENDAGGDELFCGSGVAEVRVAVLCAVAER